MLPSTPTTTTYEMATPVPTAVDEVDQETQDQLDEILRALKYDLREKRNPLFYSFGDGQDKTSKREGTDDTDADDSITEATTVSAALLSLPTLPSLDDEVLEDSEALHHYRVTSLRHDNGDEDHHVSSPRNIVTTVHTTNHSNRRLYIPSDILYDGQVSMSLPATAETIQLQPRFYSSHDSEDIFVPKLLFPHLSLADSTSSSTTSSLCEEGEEEQKESRLDDESVNTDFVYYAKSHQLQNEEELDEEAKKRKEDLYWGTYGGHYGSLDAASANDSEYALEHASVLGGGDSIAAADDSIFRQPQNNDDEPPLWNALSHLCLGWGGCVADTTPPPPMCTSSAIIHHDPDEELSIYAEQR